MPQNEHRGFAVIEIAVVSIIVSIVIAGIAARYFNSSQKNDAENYESPLMVKTWPTTTPPPNEVGQREEPALTTTLEYVAPTTSKTTSPVLTVVPTQQPTAIPPSPTPTQMPPTQVPTVPSCYSNTNPTFTHHVTDMSQVSYVVAPPTLGAGPSLKPHSYMGTNGARVPVYAPTAMTLSAGAYYTGGPYTVEFKVSCEVTVRFGHITEPVASILAVMPTSPSSTSATSSLPPIAFAAGEIVAYTTGTDVGGNWDFGVYNSATTNRYAHDPDWNMSTVYTTAVCPFGYFTADLKSSYYAKFDSTILGGNPPHGETFCN